MKFSPFVRAETARMTASCIFIVADRACPRRSSLGTSSSSPPMLPVLAGGAAGDLYGRAARALAEARRTCFRLFRPAYLWAAEQGIIRRLLPFRLRTRMVAVE